MRISSPRISGTMRAPHFSLAPLRADWNSSLFSQLYKVRSDTPSTAATSLLVRGSRSVGGVISHSKYSCRTSSAILLPFCAIKPPRRTRLTTAPPMRRNLHHRRTIRIEHSNNIIDGIDSIQLDLRGDHDLARSEEHTSELQSRENLVCRLLLEKKKYLFTARKM